jgi:hypothetical protein
VTAFEILWASSSAICCSWAFGVILAAAMIYLLECRCWGSSPGWPYPSACWYLHPGHRLCHLGHVGF